MCGPTAEGDDKHGLLKVPPPWPCPLILRRLPLATLDRHRAWVEDTRSTPTSRIRLRPLVLDRYPVPLRGFEASNRSRVRVSSPIPIYPATRARASVSLAGRASPFSSTHRGLPNTKYTSPSVGVFILHFSDGEQLRAKPLNESFTASPVPGEADSASHVPLRVEPGSIPWSRLWYRRSSGKDQCKD